MGKLMKCPDCGASVSKKAVACPSCGRSFKAEKRGGCLSGCVTIFLIAIVGAVVIAMLSPKDPNRQVAPPADQPPQASATAVLPAVTAFLREHPEFGTPGTVRETADWAEGKRQIISFGSGKYLEFYETKGKIMTVWETGRGQDRKIVWGKPYEPEKFTPESKPAAEDFPAYKVLFVGQQRRGGKPSGPKFGDVLITSLSRRTPAAERERVTRGIAAAENFDELSIYSTEEAQKANVSESFSKAHPRALKEGFLGSLREGKFTPGEEVFP